ncbi:MAG: SH3 domain-containing protein [Thermomicrobiales bacterium]|nr:SH3 domain-containing protein [Thermomicrobiales bacterium]MCO5222106.1 SH3 domain-containing protein [Thermomicrobiales bacterium]
MKTQTLIKGVSVIATALTIALGGAGIVNPELGLVRVAAQEATVLAAGQSVVVDADALNLRTDASVDAEIVTTLANGTWATVVDGPVTGEEYSWYQLEYDDVTGWAAAEFLIDSASAPALASGSTVIVNTEALNLRSSAGSASEVVEILLASTEGIVVSGPETVDDMLWYEVDFDGVQGWVSRSYLALPIPEDDATTDAATVVATDAAL